MCFFQMHFNVFVVVVVVVESIFTSHALLLGRYKHSTGLCKDIGSM